MMPQQQEKRASKGSKLLPLGSTWRMVIVEEEKEKRFQEGN